MNKNTKGGIFLFIVILSYLVYDISSKYVSSVLSYILLGVFVVLLILFYFWLNKNTNFFKKQDSVKSTIEHRAKELNNLGFSEIAISLFIFLSIFIIGLGVFVFFSDHQSRIEVFWTLSVIGLIGLIIGIFAKVKSKKNSTKKS